MLAWDRGCRVYLLRGVRLLRMAWSLCAVSSQVMLCTVMRWLTTVMCLSSESKLLLYFYNAGSLLRVLRQSPNSYYIFTTLALCCVSFCCRSSDDSVLCCGVTSRSGRLDPALWHPVVSGTRAFVVFCTYCVLRFHCREEFKQSFILLQRFFYTVCMPFPLLCPLLVFLGRVQ